MRSGSRSGSGRYRAAAPSTAPSSASRCRLEDRLEPAAGCRASDPRRTRAPVPRVRPRAGPLVRSRRGRDPARSAPRARHRGSASEPANRPDGPSRAAASGLPAIGRSCRWTGVASSAAEGERCGAARNGGRARRAAADAARGGNGLRRRHRRRRAHRGPGSRTGSSPWPAGSPTIAGGALSAFGPGLVSDRPRAGFAVAFCPTDHQTIGTRTSVRPASL